MHAFGGFAGDAIAGRLDLSRGFGVRLEAMSPTRRMDHLPTYDELPVRAGAPEGSSWGLWGDEDTLGCLNLLQDPNQVIRAAGLIRRGAVFPLDWDRALPNPPLYGRPAMQHEVSGEPGRTQDDLLNQFNPQASSQWDGFRHFGTNGSVYNGLPSQQHGVDQWARRGIVGRAVLVDVARWRQRIGQPLDMTVSVDIGAEELDAILRDQGTTLEPGDILLVQVGWIDWYLSLDQTVRDKLATLRAPRCPGLRAGREMVAALWDWHIAAVASDTPSMEVSPFGAGLPEEDQGGPYWSLHQNLLPLLGLPIGELWDMRALAADCDSDHVYECFLTSAPLNVRAGVGSPPNAIAIK